MTLPINHNAEYHSLYLRQLHAERMATLVARADTAEPRKHELARVRTRMVAIHQRYPKLATRDGVRVTFGRREVAA